MNDRGGHSPIYKVSETPETIISLSALKSYKRKKTIRWAQPTLLFPDGSIEKIGSIAGWAVPTGMLNPHCKLA